MLAKHDSLLQAFQHVITIDKEDQSEAKFEYPLVMKDQVLKVKAELEERW